MTGSATEKVAWRARLSALRRSRPIGERRAAQRANAAHLRPALEGLSIVCAFLPLGGEPLDTELLDELAGSGSTVLVPVTTGAAPLDWVRYPTPLRPGPVGIAEALGPRLGSAAVRTADVVLVPALAVDQIGRRLGRGGGHYDRTLALLGPVPLVQNEPRAISPTIAVLFDGELVPRLPSERFDVPVGAVVTPGGGIRRVDRPR